MRYIRYICLRYISGYDCYRSLQQRSPSSRNQAFGLQLKEPFSAVYISLWRREFLSNPRVYMSLYRLPYHIQWKCWSPLARDRCQPRWEFPLLLNSPAVAEHSHDMTAVLFQGSDVSFLIQLARSNTVNTHTNLGLGMVSIVFGLLGRRTHWNATCHCSPIQGYVQHMFDTSESDQKQWPQHHKNQLMIATFDSFSWLPWLLDMLK